MPEKYPLDERKKLLLLRNYDGRTSTIDQLTRLLGVPRWKVKRWGIELGLARSKEPRWTEEDIDYLEQHLHKKPLMEIARHLHRTKMSIKLKSQRLGMSKSSSGYTMQRLASCLGCDCKNVRKWIETGKLHGTRRGTEREADDYWYFSDTDVLKFITRHPEEIDQRRVGWLWVVDLLSGGIGELGKRRRVDDNE
jgi:hypothetical protein